MAEEIFFIPGKTPIDKYALQFQALLYPTDKMVKDTKAALQKCFGECLMTTARYTAMMHVSLEKAGFLKRPIVVNSIIPAIYHHFVKPLVERARARNGELLISDIHKQHLIRETVKCGFRTGSQIDIDHPRYGFCVAVQSNATQTHTQQGAGPTGDEPKSQPLKKKFNLIVPAFRF